VGNSRVDAGGGKLESTTEREYQVQCGTSFELVVCCGLFVVPGRLSVWYISVL
jgi:hypothetical protein